ncbi:DUF6326 family protein [Lacimicrobium sp. SS2-24]|uniref:DUF6326 family protein n=1 Tax=Lacimicrobium sp. SS2-24 TaxID=2005569 RepID=UPI000B4AAA61|nr:DUF6326 family protein [Lacimicrobium sp. SS2-24]
MQHRTQTILSTLWIFIVLNMFARDIHELGRPGMLEQMMSGVIDGVVITEELMLIGGLMMEVFLIMVVLSQVLTYRINRITNLVMAFIGIAIVVATNLTPDLDNIFFMVIELTALLAIIFKAWKWHEQPQADA